MCFPIPTTTYSICYKKLKISDLATKEVILKSTIIFILIIYEIHEKRKN